jgi:LacI family transcriptional regulator
MVTIKDIAKEANVSVTTVSRALNGYSDVSEETRKRIIEVAKRLNYSPNSIARSLVMKKSQTIGLLVSNLSREGTKDNFTYEVLCGINEAVSQSDYDLIVFNTTSAKQSEKTYTQLCRERRVDGVIIMGIKTNDPYLQEVVESDIPCVLIDIPIQSKTVGYVTTDNIKGAKEAVNYLLSLNHRKIGMINGHNEAFVSQQRLHGYKEALQEACLPFDSSYVENGEYTEEGAYKATVRLLSKHPEITALFCASDLMALGAMQAAKDLGKQLPDELSVIGYDDILLSSYVTPSLSTIRQDKFRIGEEAARMLIGMLEEETSHYVKLLDTQLIIRESTKCLDCSS